MPTRLCRGALPTVHLSFPRQLELTSRSPNLNESRTLTVKAETARVAAAPRAAAFEVLRSLRSAERVVLFYFMYLTLEAMVFPVSLAGRATVAILNLASSGVLMALSYFGREKPSSPDIRFGTYQDCAAPATSPCLTEMTALMPLCR